MVLKLDIFIDDEEEHATGTIEDSSPADREHSKLEDLDVGQFGDLAPTI